MHPTYLSIWTMFANNGKCHSKEVCTTIAFTLNSFLYWPLVMHAFNAIKKKRMTKKTNFFFKFDVGSVFSSSFQFISSFRVFIIIVYHVYLFIYLYVVCIRRRKSDLFMYEWGMCAKKKIKSDMLCFALLCFRSRMIYNGLPKMRDRKLLKTTEQKWSK